MQIKTKKHFNEVIKSLTEEILDEEELDEITVTADIAGYNTPFAFTGKKGKKKKKEFSTNSTDFEIVKEALDEAGCDTFAGWSEDENGMQEVSKTMFVIPLIKAVQELTERVKELESK